MKSVVARREPRYLGVDRNFASFLSELDCPARSVALGSLQIRRRGLSAGRNRRAGGTGAYRRQDRKTLHLISFRECCPRNRTSRRRPMISDDPALAKPPGPVRSGTRETCTGSNNSFRRRVPYNRQQNMPRGSVRFTTSCNVAVRVQQHDNSLWQPYCASPVFLRQRSPLSCSKVVREAAAPTSCRTAGPISSWARSAR